MPDDLTPVTTMPEPLLTAEQLESKARALPYIRGDIHQLHDSGDIMIRPQGCRVLMRAILREDAYGIGQGVAYDSRKAVAHEVLSVGSGVEAWLDAKRVPDDTRDVRSIVKKIRAWLSGRGATKGSRPRKGDHVFVLSAAADRASKTDRTCRIWLCHIDDLSASWTVPTVQGTAQATISRREALTGR